MLPRYEIYFTKCVFSWVHYLLGRVLVHAMKAYGGVEV